jgi:PAS domain S-box-containing protein
MSRYQKGKNSDNPPKANYVYFVNTPILILLILFITVSLISSLQSISNIKTKTAITFANSFADLLLSSDSSGYAQKKQLISFKIGNFYDLSNNQDNIETELLTKLKENPETDFVYKFHENKGEEKFLYISKVTEQQIKNVKSSTADNNEASKYYIIVSFPSNILNISDYQEHTTMIWRKHIIALVVSILLWVIGLVHIKNKMKDYNNLYKKIEESDKFNKELIKFTPNAIFTVDKEGKLLEVNDAAVNLTEYSRKELFTMKIDDLFTDEILRKNPFQYDDILEGKTVSKERELTTKNGAKKIVHMFSRKLPSGVLLSLMVDITTEKIYTENILQINNMLAQAEELSHTASAMISPKTNNIISSHGIKKLLDLGNETNITLETVKKILNKNDQEYLFSKRSQLKNPGDSFSFEHKITKPNGKVIWVSHIERLFLNNITGEKFIVASLWDITDQKRIHDYLVENEKTFRTVFELAQVGLLIIDADFALRKINEIFGNEVSEDDIDNLSDNQIKYLLENSQIIRLNKNAKKIIGVSDTKGLTLNLIIDEHDYPQIKQVYKAMVNQLPKIEIEIGTKNFNTNEHRLGLCSISLPVESNEKSIIVSWTDITEIKRTQIELAKNLELAQTYLNESPLFIITTDIDGHITMVNRFAENLLKIKSDDVLGNYFYDLISNDHAKKTILNIFEKIINRKKLADQQLFFKFNVENNIITVNWKYALLQDINGDVNGLLIVGNDITSEQRNYEELKFTYREIIELKHKLENNNKELQEKEEQLRQEIADKNRFFSIIAHDVKSPFSALLGLSGLLAESVDFFSQQEIKEMATGINRQANNIYQLLESLLQWSRAQMNKIPFAPGMLNLEDAVIQAVVVFKPACEKKGINIIHNVSHDINIFADANMLDTILRNLISNAVKFTNKKGSITITATEMIRFVEISVSDTGIGMSKEDIQNALDVSKHHTTPGTNQERGTGLGLIIIKDFAEKHNGRLIISSKVGQGTTIKVLLPKDKYFTTL